MRLSALLTELERIAPLARAEPWDNVGLLAGDPAQMVDRVLLTVDCTAEVAAEAQPGDCVVAYHPPLFKPVTRLTTGGPHGVVFDAIRRGIAIYSPHTALDAAEGGTNDVLADALGLVDRRPLKPLQVMGSQFKLVTFLPEAALEPVADAVTAAGAGRIGAYTQCTFRSQGLGTFRGAPGSNPAMGAPGEFEEVDEIRLETLVNQADLAAVVSALRAVHPYETPAFDLIPLEPAPAAVGIGRVGNLPESMAVAEVVDRLKQATGLKTLLLAGPAGPITSVAVCAGSGGELLDAAIAAGAGLFLTGELRHHDALKAAAAGMAVICTLHSNSERPVLASLKVRLEAIPDPVPVVVSAADRDPFRFA
jgi:dinuclear metal center YbgI/SA1388 family protein